MSRTLFFVLFSLITLTATTATTTTPSTATTTTTPTATTTTFTPTTFTPTTTTTATATTLRADVWDRPDVSDAPRYARWLVGRATWGVLSTSTPDFIPFGYPASFSDAGTGYPYFFLSPLDPVGSATITDGRVSLAISEAYVDDGCDGIDTQSPKCPKITISGKLRKIPAKSREGVRAERALFKAHPGFAGFPKTNGSFGVYRLDILRLFLVNRSGPKRDLTVDAYLYVD